MASKIGIVQRAASNSLGVIIESLDDNSKVARLTEEHYEAIVETALTQHKWLFARRVFPLTQLEAEPEEGWDALWGYPSGCLSLHFVTDENGYRLDWEERDTTSSKAIAIQQDVEDANATGTYRVAESRWPADFAMSIQKRMEAAFLRSTEQYTEADAREAMAEGLERKAMRRDNRASTSSDPSEWDLAAARQRSGAWARTR